MEQLEIHSKVLLTTHPLITRHANPLLVLSCSLGERQSGPYYFMEHPTPQEIHQLWNLQASWHEPSSYPETPFIHV